MCLSLISTAVLCVFLLDRRKVISDRRSLSAVHVGYGNNNITRQRIHQACKVIVHENFQIEKEPRHSDIAMIMLDKTLT